MTAAGEADPRQRVPFSVGKQEGRLAGAAGGAARRFQREVSPRCRTGTATAVAVGPAEPAVPTVSTAPNVPTVTIFVYLPFLLRLNLLNLVHQLYLRNLMSCIYCFYFACWTYPGVPTGLPSCTYCTRLANCTYCACWTFPRVSYALIVPVEHIFSCTYCTYCTYCELPRVPTEYTEPTLVCTYCNWTYCVPTAPTKRTVASEFFQPTLASLVNLLQQQNLLYLLNLPSCAYCTQFTNCNYSTC